MKAIIENGGIDLSLIPVQKGDKLSFFNSILDEVCQSEDAEDLSRNLTKLWYSARKKLLNNPFTFGFCSEGLEVYQDDNPNRLIFVECEVDVEI